MLSLFVVASSAAAAPLAVAVADSPTFTNATDAATNTTTAGMNATTDALLPEASDRRQRPWWERLAEKHRELRKGQSWCVLRSTHTRPCRGACGPQNTAPPSATHRVQQHRVSLEASRERGGAHARFSTLAPQPLSEPMAAAHRACEACLLRSVRHLNDAATPTPLSLGAHLAAYTSLSLTLRRLLRCAKPSARRPIAIAARKKAGLGARCSRGDPRAHFSDGRACPSLLVY